MVGILNILVFAGLVFLPPKEYADLSLSMSVPANAKSEPVEMPSATAYLVSDRDGNRLEDRFDVFELWRADVIRGRWKDAYGNRFSICRIPVKIPDSGGETRTRSDFRSRLSGAVLGPKDLDALDEAVYLLAPVDVTERFAPRRSQRKNLAALWQYGTTNENAFVYAFQPRVDARSKADWYMVSLVSDDLEAEEKIDMWLDEVEWVAPPVKRPKPLTRETDLLVGDFHRNVVKYDDWHFVKAEHWDGTQWSTFDFVS